MDKIDSASHSKSECKHQPKIANCCSMRARIAQVITPSTKQRKAPPTRRYAKPVDMIVQHSRCLAIAAVCDARTARGLPLDADDQDA